MYYLANVFYLETVFVVSFSCVYIPGPLHILLWILTWNEFSGMKLMCSRVWVGSSWTAGRFAVSRETGRMLGGPASHTVVQVEFYVFMRSPPPISYPEFPDPKEGISI